MRGFDAGRRVCVFIVPWDQVRDLGKDVREAVCNPLASIIQLHVGAVLTVRETDFQDDALVVHQATQVEHANAIAIVLRTGD